ncbi:MAG: 4Fe-4S binding protein, partial [Desulfohalobiaceae bacterium]
VISALDPVLGRELEIRPDLLVLSNGVEPNDVSELTEMLNLAVTRDGFLQEAEVKWRPVDVLKQGIYSCGLARSPGSLSETIASAAAAAERALRILSEKRLTCGNVVAEVRHSLCSLCGQCIDVCPYGARHLDMDRDMIVVDEILCQGCGSCAAVCPNSASIMRGFTDKQVMSSVDAALTDFDIGLKRPSRTPPSSSAEPPEEAPPSSGDQEVGTEKAEATAMSEHQDDTGGAS